MCLEMHVCLKHQHSPLQKERLLQQTFSRKKIGKLSLISEVFYQFVNVGLESLFQLPKVLVYGSFLPKKTAFI